MADSNPAMLLKDETYDTTKKVSIYWLPALGTFYFTVAQLFGLPYAEEVVGTIVALELLLGTILGVSNKQYDKTGQRADVGTLVVNETDLDKQNWSFEINDDLENLGKKDHITFKVRKES